MTRLRHALGHALLAAADRHRTDLDHQVAAIAWPAAPTSAAARAARDWLIDTTYGQLTLAWIGLLDALGKELTR